MMIIIAFPILLAWILNFNDTSHNLKQSPMNQINPLVDEMILPYYHDIHEFLINSQVDNKYLLKLENIRFKIIPMEDEQKNNRKYF